MEFFKNNWAKIIIAALMLVAAGVYIISLFHVNATFDLFRRHALVVALIAFFAGSAIYLICSMFDQSRVWSKYILLGVGIVCSIFAGSYFIYTLSDGWRIARALNVNWFEYVAITHTFTFLVLLALVPLVHAIRKISSGETEAETKNQKGTRAPKAVAK